MSIAPDTSIPPVNELKAFPSVRDIVPVIFICSLNAFAFPEAVQEPSPSVFDAQVTCPPAFVSLVLGASTRLPTLSFNNAVNVASDV